MRARGWLVWVALFLGAAACDCDRRSRDVPPSDPGTGAGPEKVSDPPEPDPPPRPRAIAPRGPRDDHADDGWPIQPAALEDEGWAGSEPVEARRLVYRVHLRVPPVLGDAPSTIPDAAAELFVDASDERLRARFVGPGWPVEAGSEVRLRADNPGVYVFDAHGGRPLTPGELAEWFQGGPAGRNPAPVRVRRPPPQENPGTGELVCALLAEWAAQERETVMRRCGDDGPPAMFRLGPWRAERTADVPVELPRSALRADHVGPPARIANSDSRAFMEPALLARLDPKRARGGEETRAEDAPAEGIRVQNDSRTRVVITAHGLPLGWVDPGASGHFVGLRPGQHVIAAMRPLGHLAYRPRGIRVPGAIRVR